MRFTDVVAIGRFQRGRFRMTIECKEHGGKPAMHVDSGTRKVRVVCPSGCVLGEWNSEGDLRKEVTEVRDRLVWDLQFERKKWAERKSQQ